MLFVIDSTIKNESKKAEDLTTIKSNITTFFNGAVNDEEQDLIIDSIQILSFLCIGQESQNQVFDWLEVTGRHLMLPS